MLANTVRPIWMKVQENLAEITHIAEEALTGIRVVKAFSREDFESETFRSRHRALGRPQLPGREGAVDQPADAHRASASLQIAITMGFGAWLITQGTLTEGDLLTFALWLNLLQLPVRTARLLR